MIKLGENKIAISTGAKGQMIKLQMFLIWKNDEYFVRISEVLFSRTAMPVCNKEHNKDFGWSSAVDDVS